jgi:short-subunit dehydrogenase
MAEIIENIAVITGASSGIGYASALEFARRGYHVVLAARRKELLDKVAAECEALGVRSLVVQTDVTEQEDVVTLCKEAVDTFGHIDVWVNNAGVYLTGKFEEVPVDDMRRVFDTNFFGYVYGSRAALNQFRAQSFGTLINISSVNASVAQPFVGIYSASKAAVRALDESLRMELRLEGLSKTINVCTVMPASIDTNLFQNGANYTGHRILAFEPVYDPQYAAERIVKLADHPRREMIIGPAGRFMEMQSAHTPRMYERQFSKITEKDLLGDTPEAPNTGNLYEPLDGNTGIYGGWRDTRMRADQMNAGIGVGVAVAAGLAGIGLYLLNHRDHD